MATSYTGQFMSQLGSGLGNLLNQRKQDSIALVQQQRNNSIQDEDRKIAKEKADKQAVLDEIIKGIEQRKLETANYEADMRKTGDQKLDEFESSKRISTLPISPEYALQPPKLASDSPALPTSFNPPKYELAQPGMSDLARADKFSLRRTAPYNKGAENVVNGIDADQKIADEKTNLQENRDYLATTQDKNFDNEMEKEKYSQGQQNYREGLKVNSADKSQKQDFTQENQLRTQFDGMSKDYISVRDSYKRIKASTTNVSAAGDMALIYNYMKMLDPGSTVRETEFATAAAAGSYGDRFQGAAQKVISGKRLSDGQRKDFMGSTETLYTEQRNSFGQIKDKYSKIATEYGLSPERVTGGIDFESKVEPTKLSTEDTQAMMWAKSNANDPRAKKILQLHGM